MFGKRRIIGFLLSAIFASILICVLSLAQSIANFDAKSMAMDSMTESSVYAVRKDLDTLSGQVHARVITDEDFAKIKQASPDAKLYKLYMSGLYINGYTIGHQKVPTITQSGLHIVETSGTLSMIPMFSCHELFSVLGHSIVFKPVFSSVDESGNPV